jgi:hypothetical protein
MYADLRLLTVEGALSGVAGVGTFDDFEGASTSAARGREGAVVEV